jgi:hypothetical protein
LPNSEISAGDPLDPRRDRDPREPVDNPTREEPIDDPDESPLEPGYVWASLLLDQLDRR